MSDLTPMTPEYAAWLTDLKARIHSAQQRAALAVNRELVLLYWQIGRDILERQGREGWGARVIDRLSRDLRGAFPEMKGFSPRNLKYMRAFAEAWPDIAFVQEVLAQLPWYHQIALLDKVVELKAGPFKPEHTGQLGFYLSAVDAQMKAEQDGPTIGLLLCKSKNKMVVEYALRDSTKPIGVAEYELTGALPEDLQTSLPSIEAIEQAMLGPED